MKLIWRVQPVTFGKWRSFCPRGWPLAVYEGKELSPAVHLYCDTEYSANAVKNENHRPIKIAVADYGCDHKKHGTFRWLVLKDQARTLDGAKSIAFAFLESHPKFQPNKKEK